MNSEPVTVDLDELAENPAFDEEVIDDEGNLENKRDLTHSEYDALEEAVMQTARGRTFLREHARRNRAVASDLVLRSLDECRAYFQRHELAQPSEILSAELQSMSDAIAHTRRDIAAIKPKEGANNRIMAATEDLDAIVTATERATNDILGAVERIQEAFESIREGDGNDDLFNSIEEDITNIFLACSFQDITGQRTTKVVNALRYLEKRVGAMIEIWGSEALRNGAKGEFSSEMDDDHPEAGLLNGPAMEGQGVAQADIDQLMDAPATAADESADIVEDDSGDAGDTADPTADPTADIDFDGVADPTEGVEFDAVAVPDSVDEPAEADEAAAAALDVEAAAAELEMAATGDAADEADYAGLSKEADADTIDAIFNS
jgi:chemotaxis regulatin CheY-phosphate phosphatase CheZ